ncbi:DegT/DnrJ/EryC1/StrS aminotransferase [Sulfurovum sp. enrichment culture clone C5]|uniref:DegT/DnrJ/EryC1/StrS aminotransferase n=1 Tax=Sulfurovum sp. enrichment culture clone C5 TaxID=497650 RepID=A0A0S4XNL1_9BACT|nr:DegT/DnrJ/EryC1/StrS aminotransferase [Sulfurovum sp. enrichment culture clone C5]
MDSANFISFYKPYISNSNIDLSDCLNTSKAKELEAKFSNMFNIKHSLSTMSGTSALHLAMCAIDLKRGDKVICSVNAYVDVPEVVRHFDAEPIFVDCDAQSYMIDLKKLESILKTHQNKKLRAIILNHMGVDGFDLEKLYSLAREYDVKVIEDATDAMGSKYNEKFLGSLSSDITIFSFAPHVYKDFVSGGMFTTNDQELFERAKLLRNHGIIKQCDESECEVNYLYDTIDIGWRYAMNDIVASVCLDRIETLETQKIRRHEIASKYTKSLSNVKHVKIITNVEHDNIMYFFVEIDKNRDHFARELKHNGVEVGLHYMPLHLTDYYRKKYSLRVFDFPVALGIYQKTLCLPLYASMKDDEVSRVIEAVEKIANSYI